MIWKLLSNCLNRQRYHHAYFPIGTKRRETPVEAWAFLRVKNEAIMLEKLLSSIEGIITKGVIAYNPSEDHTEQVILDFCKRHSGFIPFCYPYPVIPSHSEAYFKPYAPEHSLAAYYNAAWANIPHGAWVIKLDADHIYDREKLKSFLYLPSHDNETILLSRLNVHLEDNQVYVHEHYPYVDVYDSWLLKKTPNIYFAMHIQRLPDGSCQAYERIKKTHHRTKIYTDCINLHFPKMYKPRTHHYDHWRHIEALPQLLDKEKLRHIDPRFSHAPSVQYVFEHPKNNFQSLYQTYEIHSSVDIRSSTALHEIYEAFLAQKIAPCAVIHTQTRPLPEDLEFILQQSLYYDVLIWDQPVHQASSETLVTGRWKITPLSPSTPLKSECFSISYQAVKHILTNPDQAHSLRIACVHR